MFEQMLDVSAATCYNSYMRSIEHPFEGSKLARPSQKGTTMALAAPFPAVGTTRRPARPVRATGTLTLTRRGRAVLILAATLALLVAFLLSGRISADAGSSLLQQGRATGVVVVMPGENLWQIARAVAPDADPRETVATIRSLNSLPDSGVVAGESIIVPVSH